MPIFEWFDFVSGVLTGLLMGWWLWKVTRKL